MRKAQNEDKMFKYFAVDKNSISKSAFCNSNFRYYYFDGRSPGWNAIERILRSITRFCRVAADTKSWRETTFVYKLRLCEQAVYVSVDTLLRQAIS